MEATKAQPIAQSHPIITPEAMLEHWQGHRKLTRRVIDAFPDDQLFTYSIGGMRPFSELAMEMIHMTVPGIRGIATGQWQSFGDLANFASSVPQTKQELLSLWDKATEEVNQVWPQIPLHRFQQVEAAFGQYEGPLYATLLYFIDNEIHHRGQGYVYLRSLGVEPPAFWNRD